MRTDDILLFGAGGHGKVVLDALLSESAIRSDISVFDSDSLKAGADMLGRPVRAWPDERDISGCWFHVAIGHGLVRKNIHEEMSNRQARPLTVRHPRACVSMSATLGEGSFIAAFATISADSRIGCSTIVNHGSIVDHDCLIGNYSHFAPNATLGGGCRIGDLVLIGAGATVLPNMVIGDGAIIAAGAVVTKNVNAGEVVIGNPARPRR